MQQYQYLTYCYNGVYVNADVSLINSKFWTFKINPENAVSFLIHYSDCKKKWSKIGKNSGVDNVLVNIVGNEIMKMYENDINNSFLSYSCSTIDYFLCDDLGGDIIGYWHNHLRIKVILLSLTNFNPVNSEIQYYGDNHVDPLAFETIGYTNEKKSIVINAIKWYAEQLNYPQMEIRQFNSA